MKLRAQRKKYVAGRRSAVATNTSANAAEA